MATEAQQLLEKLDRISEVEAAQKEPLPRTFGPYLLLASLAKGGMGEVFLARSGAVAGFEKHCVVKTLRPHLTDDREYVARFIDEARVVVQLGHKNVCHVFDVGMVGERYYLAMELIAGKDLRSLADVLTGAPLGSSGDSYSGPTSGPNGPRAFDRALAVHIVGEVLEALDYAHRFVDVMGEPLHLVHRDISPQNVMLSFEGEVKLIDFGLAASTVKMEQTSPNVVMGKLAYMAPEQIRGEKLDGRADLFATAVMLTELCTGERYYAGKTPYEIWSIASSGTFRPRKFNTIDAGLRAILEKALAADPNARYASCLELRAALMEWRQQQNLFADGPRLRAVMQEAFKQDIKEHRELLAGVTSQAIQRFPTTNPSQPGLKVKEPTRSFARAGDAPAPTTTATTTTTTTTTTPPPTSARTQAPSATEAVNRGEHTGALVKEMHAGRRNALWAALAGLGIALAVVTFALNDRDPTVGDVVLVPPTPLPPEGTPTLPTPPTMTTPPTTSPTTSAPTSAPTVTPPTSAPTVTPPTVTPPTTASPATTPTVKKETRPTKKEPARAWSDLNASEKVEELGRSCRLSCVDDLKARLPTWAKNKTPAEMRQFTTDLEACHAGCGKR